jgi:NAD(P)-dependent dehydrogenase (short-subunit alcohol dehydrogenase family)
MTGSAIYPSLEGRAVFVTGGGSGIGAAIVEGLVRQRAKVAFVDIDESASQALVDRLEGSCRFEACDLRDIVALRRAVAAANQALGPLRGLVNNAARDDRHAIEQVTPEYWDDCLAVNLRHQFFAAQAVAPIMAAAGGGSIVNFGSVSWVRGVTGMVGYSTAKAAINGMTRTLARAFGPQGVRVNCVVPGAIATERQRGKWWTAEDERRFVELQALKFVLSPPDVVALVLFLLADDSRGCAGQNFVVDAGLT